MNNIIFYKATNNKFVRESEIKIECCNLHETASYIRKMFELQKTSIITVDVNVDDSWDGKTHYKVKFPKFRDVKSAFQVDETNWECHQYIQALLRMSSAKNTLTFTSKDLEIYIVKKSPNFFKYKEE